ncbi:universal stress protein [Fibrivirga algicola]|uniref:Universal stress protein n=1 Tax=Fibrivirga algicola TaxID=2950420 RepID=A0ABX0QER6_9BACT|nr:universal stress protein [Fibrivirga algicola]NID10666.1 universal stress protein [Fibrivirga algicola]
MKTIVVATDFSSGAAHAADFAVQLAKAQQAAVVLVHAFHFWPTNPADAGVDAVIGTKAVRDVCQREINHLVRTLREQHGTDVPIRTVVEEGYAMPVIQRVAQDEKADLLVMSTVGSAPQSAQLMGSLSTSMVTETEVPLLLIPPTASYASLSNVVLSIDLTSPTDAVALDTAIRFARQFNCVVNLLCIHEEPTNLQVRARATHIRDLLAHVPHTLSILTGEDVYDNLMKFAHANKANLIMMLPQKHNWFRSLFVEGNTERMARLTDIPLLAIV